MVGDSRFDDLTPTQQGWLQEAATRASRGSLAMLSDETKTLARLCADGLRAAARHLLSSRS